MTYIIRSTAANSLCILGLVNGSQSDRAACSLAIESHSTSPSPIQGSDLIVHVFAPDDPDMRSHHGKVISSDYFRPPEEYRPDTRLLLFHYQQCVIKYLRGYAWGMEPPR